MARSPSSTGAITQMLADVYWGDLDFLLLDLPPGTGDVAISLGQKLPNAEVLVVDHPAVRRRRSRRTGRDDGLDDEPAGDRGRGEHVLPRADLSALRGGAAARILFGSGGGAAVARTLGTRLGYPVELLAQVPLDPRLRVGGDDGTPIVVGDPTAPAARVLSGLADRLGQRGRNLTGRQLGLSPAGR